MEHPRNEKTGKNFRMAMERTIYLVLIVVLAIYGLINSEVAVSLIIAIKDAFSILLNYHP